MHHSSLACPIAISRLAGRVLLLLHDRFGRAQGLHETDYPFGHADLCHVLDELAAIRNNARLTVGQRREATQDAINPLLDLASLPGSWPGLDRALLDAIEEALAASGYTAARTGTLEA